VPFEAVLCYIKDDCTAGNLMLVSLCRTTF